MTEPTQDRVPAADLVLGDTISYEFAGGCFDTAVVTKNDPDSDYLVLTRPYLHTSDIAYSGGTLIAYTGLEETNIWKKDTRTFLRLRKSDVGKRWAAVQAERAETQGKLADATARILAANKALVEAQKLAESRREDVINLEMRVKFVEGQLGVLEEQRRAAEAQALTLENARAAEHKIAEEAQRALKHSREATVVTETARLAAEQELQKLRVNIACFTQAVTQ